MDKDYTYSLMPRTTARGSYGGTIVVLLIAVFAYLGIALCTVAFAQSSNSTAVSGANSEVEVTTGAAAGAAINNYGQKPGTDNRTYAEVSTAPSLGGLALGGGHPCAYSPATAQVSIIGGGAGIGGMKVDSACMLMVMGAAGDAKAYKAAQYMLAARDPAACAAMAAAGMVDCERKGGILSGGRDWSKPAVTPAAKNAGWGAKCEKVGRKITFQPTTAAAKNAELAACKARFGL